MTITSVYVGSQAFRDILGVSLNPDGTIGIVQRSGISNVSIEDIPPKFLDSWGIKNEQVEAVAANADSFIAAKAKKESEHKAALESHKQQRQIERLDSKLQEIKLKIKKIEAERKSASDRYGKLGMKKVIQELANNKSDVSANSVEYYKKEVERLDELLKKYRQHAESVEKQISVVKGESLTNKTETRPNKPE